jgi:hypothetical protein
MPTFLVSKLTKKQPREFLTRTVGLSEQAAIDIIDGLPDEFVDVLSLPLTLKMLALVYVNANHTVPTSRSDLFRQCVNLLLERSESRGHFLVDRSDKLRLLSLLATWMQDNDAYKFSPHQLSNLLQKWTTDLKNDFNVSHLHIHGTLKLQDELVQSGLFRTAADGNVEFLHRTFTAYLAALNIQASEVSKLLVQASWQTSLLLWASLRPFSETDVLVELLAEQPVLLGAVMRERHAQRAELDAPYASIPVGEYFARLAYYFDMFLAQFKALTDLRWGLSKVPGHIQAVVSTASSTEYLLLWRVAHRNDPNYAVLLNWEEFEPIIGGFTDRHSATTWHIPIRLMNKYHPLEAAYSWTVRALQESLLLTNWTWTPTINPPPRVPQHPAIAALLERFEYYREFVETLPDSVKALLPFYATAGFDLVADIHYPGNLNEATIVYALLPRQGAEMRIDVRFLGTGGQPGETPILAEGEGGRWYATFDGQTILLSKLQSAMVESLISERASFQAQKWLRSDLSEHLPGFPPKGWQL